MIPNHCFSPCFRRAEVSHKVEATNKFDFGVRTLFEKKFAAFSSPIKAVILDVNRKSKTCRKVK